RTPKRLSEYAIILFANTCVDLVAAFCSWFCTAIVVYEAGAITFVYIGPCTIAGALTCHAAFSLYVDLNMQSTVLIMMSFAYRLWTVRKSSSVSVGNNSFKLKLCVICLVSMIPMSVNSVNLYKSFQFGFFLSGTFPSSSSMTQSVYNMTGRIPSTDNLLPRIACVSTILMCSIGFIVVFSLRRSLVAELAKIKMPAHKTERKILRTLTLQMMLPLVYILGISMWFLDVTGVIKSTALRRSVITVGLFY
ncbi:hypothetical protein PFISCL1PPCAC_13675, partial [Pristionchus fissidentatus]